MSSSRSIDELNVSVARHLRSEAGLLSRISHAMFDQPELGFQEYEAAAILSGSLSSAGYTIHQSVPNAPTSFQAGRGSSRHPRLALFVEYDAVPGFGHFAGKPLAAAATVLAARALAHEAPDLAEAISIVGTPASEAEMAHAGGKAAFVESGGLSGIDAALMLQASNETRAIMPSAPAARLVEIRFSGRASHAAASPERGINALEAALQTFALMNALRQHLPPEARIDGVIVHGGSAANIVPETATVRFWLRAPGLVTLRRIYRRLVRCAELAAAAEGGTAEIVDLTNVFQNVIGAPAIGAVVQRQWAAVGEPVATARPNAVSPSDFGNVSQQVPSAIVPFRVTDARPRTAEFATATRGESALAAALQAAGVLARSAIVLLTSPDALATGRQELRTRLERMQAFAQAAGDD